MYNENMSNRKKILILENDDFLRELLGNILHKQGAFILNGFTIEQGLKRVSQQNIDIVILGTSCEDYKDKKSIHHLNQTLERPKIFIINNDNKPISGIPKDQQFFKKEISVQKIIQSILK